MKHASTGTNYAILTKWVKEQHKKKPVSSLKSMLFVVFEQLTTKFTEIFVNFFIGKKSGNHLSGHKW